MQIKKITKVKKEEEVLDKITCDWCEKVIYEQEKHFTEGGTLHIHFGYGSDFDMDIYNFDICNNCFKEHILPHNRNKVEECL